MAGRAEGAPATNLTSRLLGPSSPNSTPLIICFHGSGEYCSPSWDALSSELSNMYRVLLPDRGAGPITPSDFASKLLDLLVATPPPYVLIAHSYGGTFARYFLNRRPEDVAGMVMVETGQETALEPEIEQRQSSRQVLGSKPLSVIRGNSLIAKFNALEALDADSEVLRTQRRLLKQWDAEDERLKKSQLALSRNHRYVHIPDCGHHVIRDMPHAVAEEVKWVMQNLRSPEDTQGLGARVNSIRTMWAKLRRYSPVDK